MFPNKVRNFDSAYELACWINESLKVLAPNTVMVVKSEADPITIQGTNGGVNVNGTPFVTPSELADFIIYPNRKWFNQWVDSYTKMVTKAMQEAA